MLNSAKVGAALLFFLTPQVPPSIREEGRITNVSGLAGQSLTLECDTNGFPAPEVAWLKDGQLVGNSGGAWDGEGWDFWLKMFLCVLRGMGL